jgi:hypothetical protein
VTGLTATEDTIYLDTLLRDGASERVIRLLVKRGKLRALASIYGSGS